MKVSSMNRCPVCKGRDAGTVFREHGVDVLRCRTCAHVYSSFEAPQYYEGYWDDKLNCDDQHWWDEAHRPMYDDFCRRFIRGRSGRLLDVGCGLGFFLKAVAAFPAWQVVGCEASPKAVEYARTVLGLQTVHCGHVERAGLKPASFDLVTLWDVIEHIPDPDPLLSAVGKLLKPGGSLFLHTPNASVQLLKARVKKMLIGMKPGAHYLEAKDHLNLYSPKTLAIILRRNGFTPPEFLHLRPIRGIAGSRSRTLSILKEVWRLCSQASSRVSAGRLNIDNLFATTSPLHS